MVIFRYAKHTGSTCFLGVSSSSCEKAIDWDGLWQEHAESRENVVFYSQNAAELEMFKNKLNRNSPAALRISSSDSQCVRTPVSGTGG